MLNIYSISVYRAPIATGTPYIEFIDREIEGVTYAPIGDISNFPSQTLSKSDTLQLLATICANCNEASIEYRDGVYERVGEPTEAALKVLVEKMGSADPTLLETSEVLIVFLFISYYCVLFYRCGISLQLKTTIQQC